MIKKTKKNAVKLTKIISKFNLKELFIPDLLIKNEYEFSVTKTSQGIYEFLGYDKNEDKIVVLDFNFLNFYNSLTNERKKEGIKNFAKKNIKIIIFSNNLNDQKLFLQLKLINIPILQSNLKTFELTSLIDPYVIRSFQEPERIHGSMISVYGEGIIIIGESGIGKSETTLELIKRNHLFIGDDALDIINYANRLIGSAPKITREFLEVRGIGIVNIKKTYGISVIKNREYVDLIIELVDLSKVKSSIDRLGQKIIYRKIKNVDVPLIQIPISGGKNISDIIETAVMVFKQKKYDNYNAIIELNENLKNIE